LKSLLSWYEELTNDEYESNVHYPLRKKPRILIQMDIGGHLPFPTGSKQFSDNFGNLLFLAVLTSGAILRA
jgi:hypothetical protein